MPTDCISFQNSGYFSQLVTDYLNEKPHLESFYHRFPKLDQFEAQIIEKQKNFDSADSNTKRVTLVAAIKEQCANLLLSPTATKNIEYLADYNTFTVTTGHQLTLFTGPLYFLYKIISTINLCNQLKQHYPKYHFVPIYWMASEDHDFEEICSFNFNGKKIKWNTQQTGAVGKMKTHELKALWEVFTKELGNSIQAEKLKLLFKKAYLDHDTLSEATRYLVNELFGSSGLVILDGDHAPLKKQFAPYIKDDLLNQNAHRCVSQTIKQLTPYAAQVNPREINLFYLADGLRERIVLENQKYQVKNTHLTFSETEILYELENHPERFSPNVLLRPLYQEVILPNLCYMGGGGEIAYWLELKSYFESQKITFPMLLVRNSAVLLTEKQDLKRKRLTLSWSDLFLKQAVLLDKKTKEYSEFTIDFTAQKIALHIQFEALHEMAKKTDPSFLGAVQAQEKKQQKGLSNLEKRLLKAEKKRHQEALQRIIDLQNDLFPNQSLQERQANFSAFYLEYGVGFLERLLLEFRPLKPDFSLVVF